MTGPERNDDADAPADGRDAGNGASLRRVLRVGCPMWAHASWAGRFLSPGMRGRELEEYAGWCNAVEGNTTFYATPSAPTVARWAEQAPADFRFAFKVPRHVTHELRLRGEAIELLGEFLDAVEPLGDRVGPVQLQLPPSFGPDAVGAFRSFIVMGAAPIVRVIGADDPAATVDGLRAWTTQLSDWIVEGREPYLFVHQPENLESPALARLIHAEVAAIVDGLDSLPVPLPVTPATEVVGQSTLF